MRGDDFHITIIIITISIRTNPKKTSCPARTSLQNSRCEIRARHVFVEIPESV